MQKMQQRCEIIAHSRRLDRNACAHFSRAALHGPCTATVFTYEYIQMYENYACMYGVFRVASPSECIMRGFEIPFLPANCIAKLHVSRSPHERARGPHKGPKPLP